MVQFLVLQNPLKNWTEPNLTIPSEYEAFTDSDGYDTIPESEYEEFTDGEEPDIPESEFEGDNNELGHGGGRGQEGGESGGLMDDDEEEKDEMVYF